MRKEERVGGSGQAAVFGSPGKLPIGRLTLVCAGRSVVLFREPHETLACSSGVIFSSATTVDDAIIGYSACVSSMSGFFHLSIIECHKPEPQMLAQ